VVTIPSRTTQRQISWPGFGKFGKAITRELADLFLFRHKKHFVETVCKWLESFDSEESARWKKQCRAVFAICSLI
jgi:hypothetical protein